MAQIHWWRDISAAINRGELQIIWILNQPRIVVHFTSQDGREPWLSNFTPRYSAPSRRKYAANRGLEFAYMYHMVVRWKACWESVKVQCEAKNSQPRYQTPSVELCHIRLDHERETTQSSTHLSIGTAPSLLACDLSWPVFFIYRRPSVSVCVSSVYDIVWNAPRTGDWESVGCLSRGSSPLTKRRFR